MGGITQDQGQSEGIKVQVAATSHHFCHVHHPLAMESPRTNSLLSTSAHTPPPSVHNDPPGTPPKSGNHQGLMPYLLPSGLRRQAFVYCYAKCIAAANSDFVYCLGCKYNLCSQQSHRGCKTNTQRTILESPSQRVPSAMLNYRLSKLVDALGLERYNDAEINMLSYKCTTVWKRMIANCVLYEFVQFPDDWSQHI